MNRVTLLCYLKALKENGYKNVPAGLIEVDRLIELLELEIQVQAQEEWHAFRILVGQIPPDPIEFGSAEWYAGVKMIDPTTLEEVEN